MNDVAENELSKKLKLEKTFKRELRSVFNRMAVDLRTQYAANGTIPIASDYDSAFESALNIQYERTQKAFLSDEESQENDNLLAMLMLYRKERAPQQTKFISETNQKQMSESVKEAALETQEDGVLPDHRTTAITAAVFFRRKYSPRVGTIALTETQNAAENTKFQENIVVTDSNSKSWATVGDKRVRLTHVRANGQRVNINEPFLVGGALLMYPGDTSMGAPIKEVAGCRCSALYRRRTI